MAELDDLLVAASKAERQDRIAWRDPLAAHGLQAIPVMRLWLATPELGAFAVRVLEKIADQPPCRLAAIDALGSIDQSAASAPVMRDVLDVLARLDQSRTKASNKVGSTWPGYGTASTLEQRFHDDMLNIFRAAGEATRKQRTDGSFIRGYWASYFLRAVRNRGGLPYAHQLLRMEGTTEGFARLTEERRLDLTMEVLVLRPEYESLFSPQERRVASSRLARAGYQPPSVT